MGKKWSNQLILLTPRLMVTTFLEEKNIGHLLEATVNFIKLPLTKMWLDYDPEADALYLHFEEKPTSTHSEMRDDGIILDYRDDVLVGLTILEASHR
ncbi:MAG: DUF2283 domain-containing protein [Anaerolineae bacterium]|nr:DUF2283 domain-containing protein [Anaerolineae bacterium]